MRLKIIILVMIFFSITMYASEEVNKVSENLDNEIISLVKGKLLSDTASMAVVIQKDGETKYMKAFGYAYYKDFNKLVENPVEITTESLFDLASITKIMGTTVAIKILISENKLQLHDSVSKYLREFKRKDKKHIRIYDLLTHTSGLPAWRPLYIHVNKRSDIVKYIAKEKLEYKTGEKVVYSDLGFITLGFIIEKITGQRIDDFLRKKIYQPLAMHDTGYLTQGKQKSKAVATEWGNFWEKKLLDEGIFGTKEKSTDFTKWREYTIIGEVNDGNTYYAMNSVSAHAGLFSSPKDMTKLIQLLLNKGTYGDITLYKQELADIFTKGISFPDNSQRALGFDYSKDYMGKKRPKDTYGHTGFTGICLSLNNQANLGIMIFTNRQNVGINNTGTYTSPTKMCSDIMDAIYKEYKL